MRAHVFMQREEGCRPIFMRSSLLAVGLAVGLLAPGYSVTWAQDATPGDAHCDVLRVVHTAHSLAEQHQEANAIALLHKLEGCPKISNLDRFHIGSTYGKLHDFDDALRAFASSGPEIPNPQAHAYAVALTYLQSGNAAAAVDSLVALGATTALDGDSTNLLAVAYAKQGQYQFAYDLLLNRLQSEPRNLNAYLNLITLLSDAGQFLQARKIAQQCVAAFPAQPDPLIELGAVETLLGELQDAEVTFGKAVAAAPKQPDPRFFLALTDYRLNDFARARTDINAAAREGVVDADLLYLLAESMLKLEPNKPEAALLELDRAIALDPASVPARTLRGKILLEQGHPQRAEADLELAHSLEPKMRSATYNLARTYFAIGKKDKAEALYRLMSQQTTNTIDELSEQRMHAALATQP